MNRSFRTRIGGVRLKRGGATLRILRSATENNEQLFLDRCREVMGVQKNVAGFALVAWGPDGSSVAEMQVSKASNIPSMLVPDFVRNRLLAQKIEDWTLDEVEKLR